MGQTILIVTHVKIPKNYEFINFLLKTLSLLFQGGLVPLHNACSYGHLEVVVSLVTNGANVNSADLWKFTPLHEASAKGKYEICKILLEHGADPHRKNRDSQTPLDLARDNDIKDILLGDSALLDAAKKGCLERVKKLLTKDNVNCRDVQGRNSTPLHLGTVSSLYYHLQLYRVKF